MTETVEIPMEDGFVSVYVYNDKNELISQSITKKKKKESICPKCGEGINLDGPQDRPQLGKKKKRKNPILIPVRKHGERFFSFNETLDEHWKLVIQEVRFRAFTHSSSFVGNVKYDQDNQTMEIILNGKTYNFCQVEERLFDAFKGAPSKGEFFNREIKRLHDC